MKRWQVLLFLGFIFFTVTVSTYLIMAEPPPKTPLYKQDLVREPSGKTYIQINAEELLKVTSENPERVRTKLHDKDVKITGVRIKSVDQEGKFIVLTSKNNTGNTIYIYCNVMSVSTKMRYMVFSMKDEPSFTVYGKFIDANNTDGVLFDLYKISN